MQPRQPSAISDTALSGSDFMNFASFAEKYNLQLSDEQREAVCAPDRHVLLLAVPGSGKTTVLVTRCAYLFEVCNIKPERIAAVTFNRAAALDMQRRYEQLFGPCPFRFRTIHSLCSTILDQYASVGGRTKFTLLPETQAAAMVAALYRELTQQYADEYTIRQCLTGLTYIANTMVEKDELSKLDRYFELPLSALYRAYRLRKREHGVMDFDDLLSFTYAALKKYPSLAASFGGSFQYFHVDEAQDTSRIQHEIIAALETHTKNLFVAGDEDQSIYSFRGACPEELLRFKDRYSDAKIYSLSCNYRSTPQIVSAAARFIQKNSQRYEKRMVTHNPDGAQIRSLVLPDLKDRAAYLIRTLLNPYMQTAVLFRTGETALPLIDLLLKNGLPFCIRGENSTFFCSSVVNDIKAALRFARNPRDSDAYLRIYYKLNFKVNRQQAETVCQYAKIHRMTIPDAAECCLSLRSNQKRQLARMRRKLHHILLSNAYQAIRIVLEIGYRRYLCSAKEEEEPEDSDLDPQICQTVHTLLLLADQTPELGAFLERLDILHKTLSEKEFNKPCPVILSTIHSAKGLEFDRVILIGAGDGGTPSYPSKTAYDPWEQFSREEDRRLFYVAVTRAKKELWLESHKESFGVKAEEPTFIRELFEEESIPKDRVSEHVSEEKQTVPTASRRRHENIPVSNDTRPSQPLLPVKKEKNRANSGGSIAPPPKPALRAFQAGTAVLHRIYGKGEILAVEGDRCRVRFAEKGTRLLSLSVCIEHSLLSLWQDKR